MLRFDQTPLRNTVTMATAKVPGDQKLFEIVCHVLIRKVNSNDFLKSFSKHIIKTIKVIGLRISGLLHSGNTLPSYANF